MQKLSWLLVCILLVISIFGWTSATNLKIEIKEKNNKIERVKKELDINSLNEFSTIEESSEVISSDQAHDENSLKESDDLIELELLNSEFMSVLYKDLKETVSSEINNEKNNHKADESKIWSQLKDFQGYHTFLENNEVKYVNDVLYSSGVDNTSFAQRVLVYLTYEKNGADWKVVAMEFKEIEMVKELNE